MLMNVQEEPICVLITAPTPLAHTLAAVTQAFNSPEMDCIAMVAMLKDKCLVTDWVILMFYLAIIIF